MKQNVPDQLQVGLRRKMCVAWCEDFEGNMSKFLEFKYTVSRCDYVKTFTDLV